MQNLFLLKMKKCNLTTLIISSKGLICYDKPSPNCVMSVTIFSSFFFLGELYSLCPPWIRLWSYHRCRPRPLSKWGKRKRRPSHLCKVVWYLFLLWNWSFLPRNSIIKKKKSYVEIILFWCKNRLLRGRYLKRKGEARRRDT